MPTLAKLNFQLSELIHSDIAVARNINNMPDIRSLDNMLNLIVLCLQPIRELIGKPMVISSGFRCKELNHIVGGQPSSQHTKGQAVDFTIRDLSVPYIIDVIRHSSIEYDQLINEYNKWVHISFVRGKNRKQTLHIA